MSVPEQSDSWRKASYSQQETACVEIARDPAHARVRDTKDRSSGHLTVPESAWSALFNRL